jgi:hypothetical protein
VRESNRVQAVSPNSDRWSARLAREDVDEFSVLGRCNNLQDIGSRESGTATKDDLIVAIVL